MNNNIGLINNKEKLFNNISKNTKFNNYLNQNYKKLKKIQFLHFLKTAVLIVFSFFKKIVYLIFQINIKIWF